MCRQPLVQMQPFVRRDHSTTESDKSYSPDLLGLIPSPDEADSRGDSLSG
jgi:hypothetical protein